MATNPVAVRYTLFSVLIIFGLLWYVNVNKYLFKNTSTNFEVARERDTLLDVIRNLVKPESLSQALLEKYNQTTGTTDEQKYSEKIVNQNDLESLVNRRVEFTRNVCEEKLFGKVYTEFKFKDIGHMLVDEKHQLIFCYVPKVSCSTWKILLKALFSTHHTGRRSLHDYSPEEINYRLKNYRKAMFVRDPITRFLSAFLHKFHTASAKTIAIWEKSYGRTMIEHYRPWMELQQGQTGLNISVSEFIKYIVNLGENYSIDPLRDHWLPMYRSCDPCKFQPEFIGHFENLEQEGPYLLKWLGVNGTVNFPEYHASDAADKLVKAYAKAEMGLMRELRSYYHRDYELFNYSANDTMRKVLFGE